MVNSDNTARKPSPLLASEEPDIAQIMADIRERVRSITAERRDSPKSYSPSSPKETARYKAGAMLHSEELRYLNSNYSFGPGLDTAAISSHRPSLIGKTIVFVKRKLLNMIWDLLKGYFASERDFHANLVRYLNENARYVDDRDASNFWDVIRKIDVDTTKAVNRLEQIHDEQIATVRAMERRFQTELHEHLGTHSRSIEAIEARHAELDGRLAEVDRVVKGLEGLIARLPKEELGYGAGGAAHGSSDNAPAGEGYTDQRYVLLENRFRGSEEEICSRLVDYPERFKDASLPVLEIGSGRGELLGLFRESGIEAYGIEIDRAMVEATVAKDLKVIHGDGLLHLSQLSDNSLGGVIAIQVVEHLTRSQLQTLFALCEKKVASGGRIVFETINPRSLMALSSNYFRDPTHVWPLHPDTLSYELTLAGLEIEKVDYRSPVSKEALLRSIPEDEFMTPRWKHSVDLINHNIGQLNELLYGYQDYSITAIVR